MPPRLGGLLALARVQSKKHKAAKLDDVVSFFQQLSTLLVAGTPLLHAIRLCGDQNESIYLSDALKDMGNKIAGGNQFNQAAAEYPNIFESHWIQMIRTGEVSGQLGPIISQLNADIQKTRATRNKVKGALIYPVILLGVSFLSLFIMLWKVVPTFAEFFADFGGKLPAITQFVIDLSAFIQRNGVYMVGAMVAVGYGFRRYQSTLDGKKMLNSLMMITPLLGEIFIQSAMEKFASNLALLLRSGTPLLESLRTVQEVFHDDPIYFGTIASIYNGVSRGEGLVASMERTGLFTNMMISLVKVGEESGKLSDVLDQVAGYYRERLDTLVTNFTSLLEPMIVIGMGVLVAGLLASIYLPMVQMAGGGG